MAGAHIVLITNISSPHDMVCLAAAIDHMFGYVLLHFLVLIVTVIAQV